MMRLVENFLDDATIAEYHAYTAAHEWKLSTIQLGDETSTTFFIKGDRDAHFADKVAQRAGEVLDKKFNPIVVNFNGLIANQPVAWHTDEGFGSTHSVVWYANQDWSETDGGQLELVVDETPQLVTPLFNRAVVYESRYRHRVLPHVKQGYMRFSLAVHMREMEC